MSVFLDRVLGTFEKAARVQNREYEARLAATLRDISILHDSETLTDEQIACFSKALLHLLSNWGKTDRAKLKEIRTDLLRMKLSWIP